jgi:hypothetical protein
MSYEGHISKQIKSNSHHSKKSPRPKTLHSPDHSNRNYYNVLNKSAPSTHLYRIPVRIGNFTSRALIDMGAATSIISPNLLSKIFPSVIQPITNKSTITLSGFNGSSTESAGRFKVPLILRNNHHYLHDFYVVPNITDECILGLDFMHKYGVKFDGKTGSISYDSNGQTHNLIKVVAIKNQPIAESIA